MLAHRTLDDDVELSIGQLDLLQLVERALSSIAIFDDLRDETIARQGARHRPLRTKGADTPDRYPRLLSRVADCREVAWLDRVVLPVVAERLTGPQAADDVEALVEQLAAYHLVGLFAERLVAAFGRAQADTDRHPPFGQPVDRRDLPREFPRLATWQRGQHRSQAQRCRPACGDCKRDPGVNAPHGLPHEESIPTMQFGNGRQFADFFGVSPRHYEAELHQNHHRACETLRATDEHGTRTEDAITVFVVDFQLPGADDARRVAVRQWLTDHPSPSGRQLADAGYVAPQWPEPWGLGADPIHQLIIDDELSKAKVRRPANPIGIGWAGPTLMYAGTDEQKKRYLPTMLSAEEYWCQLFSEPGSGSDLASLGTRAVRDGDEFVVNGQKIWTSGAKYAAFGILLARTDPEVAKHKGISYFICPMKTPGVEVRPITEMTGGRSFNEVFFTDVRIPADNLVGELND
ncbi:MAG: hypothetical protein QOH53_398, partial [Ilumatobacteraceae bacterium]